MAVKNIILCSDGTGNSDTEGRGTNVFKLYEAVDIHGYRSKPNLPRQIAFYDDGVGTENFALHRIIGAAFGYGFAQNVRDLYTELVHVYDPGDKLFLFGFSRGAYTIRALSGLIQYCGVLDRAGFPNEEQLKAGVLACWKSFEKVAFPRFISPEEDRRRRSALPAEDSESGVDRRKLLGSYSPAIEIEFVGVWDTVGAVGMPVDELKPLVNWICPRKFDELTPGRVKRACHALSIDDERRTFRPELWNERGAREGQIDQVWFAGVHSNVGGGYPKQGLSLVTLDWMMSEAEKCGLHFIQAARDYVQAERDVHSKLYDSRAGLAVYYRWEPRNIAQICKDHGIEKPKIHASVFERIAFRTDGYAPGNIPADLEVTNLQGPPGQTQQINTLVQKAIQALSVPSLLDMANVKRWIRAGKASYYGFLGLSIFGVGWGLCAAMPAPPVNASVWRLARDTVARLFEIVTSIEALWHIAVAVVTTWWWFAPGLAVCYALAMSVDCKLERRFSGFWHKLRQQLRAFF